MSLSLTERVPVCVRVCVSSHLCLCEWGKTEGRGGGGGGGKDTRAFLRMFGPT